MNICANCGEVIRPATAEDGYSLEDVKWVHAASGNMFCDMDPPRATPGGEGWG